MRRFLLVFVAAGVALAGVIVIAARPSQQDEPFQEFVDRHNGEIELGGRIVDESGEPVEGVNLHVTASYWEDQIGFKTRDERERLVVDGEFWVRREGVSGVDLLFLKQGYFVFQKYFTAASEAERRYGGYTNTDLVVVLEKKPEPAPLESMTGHLRYDEHGPAAVVRLLAGTRDAYDLRKAGSASKVASEPYVMLQVESSPDGELQSEPYRSGGGMAMKIPARAALSFANADGGFAVYTPRTAADDYNIGFREMREAPEEGYTPRLEFSDEMGDYVYFYCQVAGKYGKGRVTHPYFLDRESEPVALAPVIILLNPTGSRYVATDK